jgi:hypothetical protein
LLTPGVLCASAAKLAHTSVYRTPPILCDSVDDDTTPSILYALTEETKKKLSSTNANTQVIGKIRCLAICGSRITSAETASLIAVADSPLRFKRPQRARSSDDPDSPH